MTNPDMQGVVLVLMDIRAGYGVEDIALRLSMAVDDVRKVVADLREAGILAQTDWRAAK